MASVADAAAVCSKAGGEAVTCVPVCTRAGEGVVSSSVKSSARARRDVAHMLIKVRRTVGDHGRREVTAMRERE